MRGTSPRRRPKPSPAGKGNARGSLFIGPWKQGGKPCGLEKRLCASNISTHPLKTPPSRRLSRERIAVILRLQPSVHRLRPSQSRHRAGAAVLGPGVWLRALQLRQHLPTTRDPAKRRRRVPRSKALQRVHVGTSLLLVTFYTPCDAARPKLVVALGTHAWEMGTESPGGVALGLCRACWWTETAQPTL